MATRSKEQLAVLLKLIEVNSVSLRKNVNVRQKVWQRIAEKLNGMQGAQKDIDGWKRSYNTWRMNSGKNYHEDLQRVIKNVADDDYFYIHLTDDEDDESNVLVADNLSTTNPMEKQNQRLHELMNKHKSILNSNADDEPLKTRIWLNITEELNAIPNALYLTAQQWKQRVDLNQYKIRRGRKRLHDESNAEQASNIHSIKFEVIDSDTMCSQATEMFTQEHECNSVDDLIIEDQHGAAKAAQTVIANDDTVEDIEMLLSSIKDDGSVYSSYEAEHAAMQETAISLNGDEDDDDKEDEQEYKSQIKRIKPTPIVKAFTHNKRIVNAVEQLSSDVGDLKELLRRTTITLECLENVLQQQCRKQEETNVLLRQNQQLLTHFLKSGRHPNAKQEIRK